MDQNAASQPEDQHNPNESAPTPIILVHGAWHGAWCWAGFQAELDRRGLPSLAIDLPGHGASTEDFGGLLDDALYLSRVLDSLARKSENPGQKRILVGHSYGGAVITQAAMREQTPRDDIDHLVYVAAFAPEAGESVSAALEKMYTGADDATGGSLLRTSVLPQEDDSTTLDPTKAKDLLYADCGAAEIAAAIHRLCPQPNATMREAVTGNPRASLPSTYIRCLRDRAIEPSVQAQMAKRCDRSVDFDTDHSPFMSAPLALADQLESLALK
ncbi:MAG: alpha/beta fold hydrolase [Myxococcota bacterium]